MCVNLASNPYDPGATAEPDAAAGAEAGLPGGGREGGRPDHQLTRSDAGTAHAGGRNRVYPA